ncbi:MAG TPA: proton-conducting transporter membrane subunit [Methanospirillum sp.]|uniref:proton-conducting transporter transmembrane domain-containing protein n=1 Tax=Methanospirillum sp. TaxID=45200 RepID=UPI002BDB5503|nr:proton-conducting transporter membrane subunit [Methanospirillum sp.]HWQ62867.1 proton-conducting transporter membrane subunit [Methanospirillum sp.]
MIDLFIPAVFFFLAAGAIPIWLTGIRSYRYCSLIQGCAGVLTILASAAALLHITGGELISFSLTPLFPVILGIDRLTAAFSLLLGILTIAVCCYSPGYISRMHGERSRDLLCSLIPIFLASMLLVVLSRTTFAFLFFWEVMAVSSFFLVLIEYQEEKTRRAAFFYLAMTQLSTVCIFLGVIQLYLNSGSFEFPTGISITTLPGLMAFLSIFLGIAIKAGAIPFHKWLPYAHPAAASPVSALMSGMMLNTALYMLVRAVTGFFIPNITSGLVILFFGCLTAVLGVMYAVKEQDLKGLLAYSSIDNTGVILIGIGLFVVFTATGHQAIGTMALLGAVFHAVSHGLFKGLLFLTAGSVNVATGTRNIDELGGLLVRMPWTGGLFFVGVLAISALPPLNGFAGELLIYQALITGLMQSEPLMQVLLVIVLSLFGLTGALTAVCFVKAFGLTFLALPRTPAAKQAHEVPLMMRTGPAVLSIACILSGIFSSQILAVLGYPGYLPDLLLLSILLIGALALTYAAVYSLASRETRISITWGCGMQDPTSKMEYTGSGFTEPVVRIFAPIFRTRITFSKEYQDSEHCFVKAGVARIELMKFFEEYLYLPAARLIDSYGSAISQLQNGNVDTYVLYVFGAVVVLVVVMGWLA